MFKGKELDQLRIQPARVGPDERRVRWCQPLFMPTGSIKLLWILDIHPYARYKVNSMHRFDDPLPLGGIAGRRESSL